jgi:parallel beta-helix repeat protein
LIGTNSSGTSALGNYVGIYFGSGGTNNTFDNNTISGNYAGIYFSDASFQTVSNNRIGTNSAGTGAVPNNYGVWAECGTDLTFSGNIIGGNTNAGMQLSAIQNSLLSNNTVGGAVPNGGAGIELTYLFCGGALEQLSRAKSAGGAKSISFGANNESDGNRIEDSTISNNSGHGVWIVGGNNNTTFDNRINSNTGDGVRIEPHCCDPTYGGPISPAVGNSLILNDVYGNGGKNVNLGFDGAALANDSMDADSGPNNWQNRPVISSVTLDTGKNVTTIAFSLDSKAGDYNIDFYSNPSPGVPAGQNYLGNTVISLAVDGPASGTYSRSGTSADNISALATRVGPESPAIQDSSEYSDEVAAAALPVPGVSVIPASIDFGDAVVGRSVGPAAITIGSVGTGDYTISALRDGSCTGPAICSTGSFICSTSCVEASPYRPGTTCTINASFAPTSLGPQSKSLALCDDAAGSPRTITFTGNGISTPVVDIGIAPLFWSFGQVLVGLTSGPQSFTVSNLSASQVYLGTARTTGDFSILGGNCGATLAGNSTCSIDAVFAPLASGGVNGTLEVTGSDQPIPAALRAKGAKAAAPTTNTVIARLQGSGVQFGDLRLPATMNFGALLLHSAPGHQSLTLTNTGNGPLAISSISVSGPFTLTNGCGSTLAAGESCTVTLDFNPSALGTFNGSLTVISDAPGGSRSIALSANVVADARPVVRVSAATMGFGQRIIGSDSPPQRLTITNDGAAPASLTGVTFTQPEASGRAEYSLGGTSCGATLAPQASCTADVVFKALGFGSRQGELQVPSNSSDSPARVQLGGTGCRPLTPDIIRTGRDPCAP